MLDQEAISQQLELLAAHCRTLGASALAGYAVWRYVLTRTTTHRYPYRGIGTASQRSWIDRRLSNG
jgi:hypothetical protein